MAWTNPTHQRAAELAGDYLPEYMATWIAGVLRETHALPALVRHQDQLAQDVLSIAVVQHDDDPKPMRDWCNCQAIEGTPVYPGPWHPRGDLIGCPKFGWTLTAQGGEVR